MRLISLVSLVAAAMLLLCGVVSPLASAQSLAPASTKVFVHNSMIDFVQRIINSLIVSSLTRMSLPDIPIPIVGGSVNLTNVYVSNVYIVANAVELTPPNQLTIGMSHVGGDLDFDWEYNGPLGVSFGGTGASTFNDTNIDVLVTLTADATGHPIIDLTSVKVTIGSLDIALSGGGGWLWSFLIGLFKPILIGILESGIDQQATAEFQQLITAVEAFYPVSIPLDGTNITMLTPLVPTVTGQGELPFGVYGDYLVVGLEVGFQSDLNNTMDPRLHDPIENSIVLNPAGKPPMLGVSLDGYVAGSLLYSLAQNGFFDIHVDNSDLPENSLLRLNTALVAVEWPALYAAYPNNNLTLDISQYAPGVPLVEASDAGESISDSMVVLISVVDPSQPEPVPMAKLLINGTIAAVLDVLQNSTGLFLGGKVSPLDLSCTVLWSALDTGTLASSFAGLVSTVANDVLIPLIDTSLNEGLFIGNGILEVFPTANAFIAFSQGVFTMGFDVLMPSQGEHVAAKAMRTFEQQAAKQTF